MARLSESDTQRILAVDDDPSILFVLEKALQLEGFEVAGVDGADAAEAWIERNGLPHLAVIDIQMPGRSGIDLSREIRKYSDLPIVLLTAVTSERTMAETLEEFAEDYVTKPFHPRVLVARIRRVLDRVADFSYALAPILKIDDGLAIDFPGQRVIKGDLSEASLTPTESKILFILVRGRGRVIASDFLLRRVWPREEVFEDSLRVHIHRLRHKIEADPSKPVYVRTERGLGYSFLGKD